MAVGGLRSGNLIARVRPLSLRPAIEGGGMAESDRIVYGGYTQVELDAQYEQATLVPERDRYFARWKAAGADVRARLDLWHSHRQYEFVDVSQFERIT